MSAGKALAGADTERDSCASTNSNETTRRHRSHIMEDRSLAAPVSGSLHFSVLEECGCPPGERGVRHSLDKHDGVGRLPELDQHRQKCQQREQDCEDGRDVRHQRKVGCPNQPACTQIL